MRIALFVALALAIPLTAFAGRYDGWEKVRIVEGKPEGCTYVLQETCSSRGAKCYTWFKQRAVVRSANTVHLVNAAQSQQTSIGGGANYMYGQSDAVITAIAEYYQCPAQATETAPSAQEGNKYERLVSLKKALDAGALTQSEFDAEKAKILASP